MKHFKRLNLYKASNVQFNPETNEATSYGWWSFVKVFNGKLVFNNYTYSSSTCGHQSKVRSLLRELGLKIDLEVECPKGLQAFDAVGTTIEHYKYKINELQALIMKPRTQKKKNEERKAMIEELTKEYEAFEALVLNR